MATIISHNCSYFLFCVNNMKVHLNNIPRLVSSEGMIDYAHLATISHFLPFMGWKILRFPYVRLCKASRDESSEHNLFKRMYIREKCHVNGNELYYLYGWTSSMFSSMCRWACFSRTWLGVTDVPADNGLSIRWPSSRDLNEPSPRGQAQIETQNKIQQLSHICMLLRLTLPNDFYYGHNFSALSYIFRMGTSTVGIWVHKVLPLAQGGCIDVP